MNENNSNLDLFNNPMTQAALAAMSDEDKIRYRDIGEKLYGHINFENGKLLNLPPSGEQAIQYLEEQLKSGLHPSTLNQNEKNFLADTWGQEWYKKWGYVKQDLDEIHTVKF